MASYFIVFCVQICLIQFVIGQRVIGPPIANNVLQYGPNKAISGQQGSPQLNGVINGPGITQMASIGPNQALGPYGQIIPSGQSFAGMPNQAFVGAGVPNQAFVGTGIPSQVFAGPGMPKQIINAPCVNNLFKNNQFYGTSGTPNPGYGGSGNGEVAVNGELPVTGMASVTGHVPMTGKVTFNGNVPCGGVVTISGSCASCGQNAPFGQNQMPAFANKPYGY